jgi:hypothetical protein
MNIFKLLKPRTARGQVRFREREMLSRMEALLQMDNEQKFIAALCELGITAEDTEYHEALSVWRAYHI